MNVLNLVTNRSQFFRQQVATLKRLGVTERTVVVPGERKATDDEDQTRSPLEYMRFYPKVLRQSFNGHDVIHANYGLTAPAALAQPTRPVVVSLWGSDLFGNLGWVSKQCSRVADAVIVMSDGMAAELDGVETHVIPHGVNLELFRPIPGDVARKRVGWDDDAAQVLFPYSKQRPVKDYPRAEAVVAAARDRVDGPVELQTLFDVPHDLMPLYLNAADVLLLTSEHEGSPNSVKEALACNLPVVSTDVGDVSQLLDGVDLSSVSDSDEVLAAEVASVIDRQVRSDGREHTDELGLTRMGERILSVYESVQ